MNQLNCEYIRDVYPDILNGTADAVTVAAVRAHIARCADCREEVEVIERVHGARVRVPDGLPDRVVAGIRRKPRIGFPRIRHLALAATVAAAVIGGTLLIDSREPAATQTSQGIGFITVEDAMVSGTSSLQDLTVEELEQLLGEIES